MAADKRPPTRTEASPSPSAEASGPATESPAFPARVARVANEVMSWFPLRVFQRFSARNGSVLAAGASYQALFAIFAAVYVAFAAVGVWLGGNAEAVDRLIGLINRYLPGIISDSPGAAISRDTVHQVATQSVTTLGITAIVALLVVMWTAVAWIGSIRTTIRDIFGLPAERGNPVLLVIRDFVAAFCFALLLLIGAVLGTAGTSALSWVFSLLGLTDSVWLSLVGSAVAIAVMFVVDSITLIMMYRFLTGLALSTRDVLSGSLLGAAAITVLQLAFGFLIGKTPNNPLLVTFAVLIGLLLWIRLVMMAILLSAAWVAEAADEKNLVLEHLTDRENDLLVALTLRDAARIDQARAARELTQARLWQRWGAQRTLSRAEKTLASREAELEDLDPTPAELLQAQARAGARVSGGA